jgi:hypothetical protein
MAEGHRSTTRERLVAESAGTLAPHQSLDRIDKVSGTVTTAVTLAGAVAGGFGLVAAKSLANVGIGWALPTVILAAVSIAAAVLATVPGPAKVAPGNLVAVEAFFRGQIRRRGRLMRVAAWSLAAAVLLAPLPILFGAIRGPHASIELTVTVSGQSRKVMVAVTAAGLNEGALVQVRVRRRGHTLALTEADADTNGVLKSAVTAPAVRSGTRISVTAVGPAGKPARSQDLIVP